MNGSRHKRERKNVAAKDARAVPSRRQRPRRQNEWQDLITEQLEEARAQGAFDNLPGAGQPLRLHENPNEPPDMHMANKLLKDNDLVPAWIDDRKKLLAEIEELRAEMQQQWDGICTRLETAAADQASLHSSWQYTVGQWRKQISGLNQRIVALNITLPIWRLELHQLRLDEELERIQAPQGL